MIKQLNLKNFTVFNDLEIEFSSKINIIIGENGTGKTHLLKAAYALCAGDKSLDDKSDVKKSDIEDALTQKFTSTFMPLDGKLGRLRKRGIPEDLSILAYFASGQEVELGCHSNSKRFSLQKNNKYEHYPWIPTYISTKEILSLLNGFQREDPTDILKILFDETYHDLAKAILKDPPIGLHDKIEWLLEDIVNKMGGRFQWQDNDMLFQTGEYINYEDGKNKNGRLTYFKPNNKDFFTSNMMAEGFKKLGILQRLLQNGTVFPGVSGPLFWDEPESNLNPKLMKLLVEILLKLSRNGQQIILATHDYVLLKWFDLLMDKGKEDHVRFHSLYRDDSGNVKVSSKDDYILQRQSSISDTFAELYDGEIQRALGGTR